MNKFDFAWGQTNRRPRVSGRLSFSVRSLFCSQGQVIAKPRINIFIPLASVFLSFILLPAVISQACGQTNAQVYTPGQTIKQDFKGQAKLFLATHCVDCHDSGDPEGGLSLSDLGPVDEVNA
ncbi:MAG: hypothetical protein ACI87E_001376, partial [Mariniblastus sp.]